MLSRKKKAAFYSLFAIPMQLNAWSYRRIRADSGKPLKVQLGPGKERYLNGWVNVDANFLTARIDIWADLTNKLPFRDKSVEVFYSHHVIEHLPDSYLPVHLLDLFRCLKPGGVVRIGGPNGHEAILQYANRNEEWFGDFPDKRSSIGGRFANFILVRGEHLTILTPSYLTELAEATGFSDITFCKPIVETNYPSYFDSTVLENEWERTPDNPHTLIMEARKPFNG